MINRLLPILILMLIRINLPAQVQMPIDTIEGYFKSVKAICDKDNGRLWGKPVYSSILLIDRKTRDIVANEPDNENLLTKKGKVYIGKFPETSIISNSTTHYGGKFWTMVAYPIPQKVDETNLLFTHELFHQLQNKIGLQSFGYDNSHMDDFRARIYIKLEWLALLSAVNSKDINTKAITDALLFRSYRRSLFPGADSMENKFEMHEGLAEYTAYTLCCDPVTLEKKLNTKKEFYWSNDSYVRSFGYYSGLLYGYLLDKYGFNWRTNLKSNDDLGRKMQNLLNIVLPQNMTEEVEKSRDLYGYDSIYTSEYAAKQTKDKIHSAYRIKFTQSPIVKITLKNPRVGFDPNTLQPLDSLGTVYPSIELVDDWGILKVREGGCLLSKNWNEASIPAAELKTTQDSVIGKGWTLKMNKGWRTIKNEDHYKIVKEVPFN